MSSKPNYFRDFGIFPEDATPPTGTVRARFSSFQIFGQYLATFLMAGFGIGLTLLFVIGLPFPTNALAAAVTLAAFGYLVHRATRNDYSWVELDGTTIRAQHLYTHSVVERRVDEIDDLLTLVYQVHNETTMISEAWLGRVRGIMIRFSDHRTPLLVSRSDPAMKNAKELIEAIVYRMSQQGKVDYEVVGRGQRPMIRRIFWSERPKHVAKR